MIKVFGHRSPDTDATGAAIIWAWYLTAVEGRAAEPALLGPPNAEAAFVLDRWGMAAPARLGRIGAGDKVVIVDTNNPDELPADIDRADILAIIDHHLLAGGLRTARPIEVTIRPLGSTATVMHELAGPAFATAPRAIRGIMLSCILSDTLAFRSPTTTEKDRAAATALAEDLGIDIDAYAAEMFAAKSDISAFSDEELLRLDSKTYAVNGHRLRISVLETTAPEVPLGRKEALMAAMPGVAAADGVDEVLLFIIDILNGNATLLLANDAVRKIAGAAFGVATTGGDTITLPGVVSRKKQILPALER